MTKVDQEKERVTISLKKSMQKKQSGLTGQSLEVGQTYVGIINNVAVKRSSLFKFYEMFPLRSLVCFVL